MFNIIVAYDDAHGIGKSNDIPWSKMFKEDLQYFRNMTLNSTVIMGRKTWDSLPKKPLSRRINIVVSTGKVEGADESALSFDMALEMALEYNQPIFVIGGSSIYTQAVSMPGLKKVIVTNVHGCYGCDTYFPCLPGEWKRADGSRHSVNSDVDYSRFILERVT